MIEEIIISNTEFHKPTIDTYSLVYKNASLEQTLESYELSIHSNHYFSTGIRSVCIVSRDKKHIFKGLMRLTYQVISSDNTQNNLAKFSSILHDKI